MGIWNKIFGKKNLTKPEKSPYLPDSDEPKDVAFAKKFTIQGGFFLYNDSPELVLKNFNEICQENDLQRSEIISLNQNLAKHLQINFIDQVSGKLNHFRAVIIQCEFLISNTGKILLSNNQINHFKIRDLPKTIIVSAKINQIVRDVSQGMSQLKNKYIDAIPTNITTLNINQKISRDKNNQEEQTKSKNIYLLLEDF